jgi:hypothetical protein
MTYGITSVIPFEGFIEVIPFVIPSVIPLGRRRNNSLPFDLTNRVTLSSSRFQDRQTRLTSESSTMPEASQTGSQGPRTASNGRSLPVHGKRSRACSAPTVESNASGLPVSPMMRSLSPASRSLLVLLKAQIEARRLARHERVELVRPAGDPRRRLGKRFIQGVSGREATLRRRSLVTPPAPPAAEKPCTTRPSSNGAPNLPPTCDWCLTRPTDSKPSDC